MKTDIAGQYRESRKQVMQDLARAVARCDAWLNGLTVLQPTATGVVTLRAVSMFRGALAACRRMGEQRNMTASSYAPWFAASQHFMTKYETFEGKHR